MLTAEEAPLLEKPEDAQAGRESASSRTLVTLFSYSAQDTPLLSVAFAAGDGPSGCLGASQHWLLASSACPGACFDHVLIMF